MYAATYGLVPYTKSVLNTCKTKNCCNPRHLTLGVQELKLERADDGTAPGGSGADDASSTRAA
jgi:hypothetical protein